MKSHKNAADISLAPAVGNGEFQQLLHRYGKAALLVGTALLCAVAYYQYDRHRSHARDEASWDAFRREIEIANVAATADTARFASDYAGNAVGAWARALDATRQAANRDYKGAQRSSGLLRSDHRTHPLVFRAASWTNGEPRRAAVGVIDNAAMKMGIWLDDHSYLIANHPLASSAPRVHLDTTKGSFVVALDTERAPRLAELFASSCLKGRYNGSEVRVSGQQILIEYTAEGRDIGGSEDNGDVARKVTAFDETNDLRHFAWTLSSVNPTAADSIGSGDVVITTVAAHELDGTQTVFGAVVEGREVIRTIIDDNAIERGNGRDVSAVTIVGATVR